MQETKGGPGGRHFSSCSRKTGLDTKGKRPADIRQRGEVNVSFRRGGGLSQQSQRVRKGLRGSERRGIAGRPRLRETLRDSGTNL